LRGVSKDGRKHRRSRPILRGSPKHAMLLHREASASRDNGEAVTRGWRRWSAFPQRRNQQTYDVRACGVAGPKRYRFFFRNRRPGA